MYRGAVTGNSGLTLTGSAVQAPCVVSYGHSAKPIVQYSVARMEPGRLAHPVTFLVNKQTNKLRGP
jgi:hypothetical protein